MVGNGHCLEIHHAYVNGCKAQFSLKTYAPLATFPDGFEQLKKGGAEIKTHLSNPDVMLEYEDGELTIHLPPTVTIEARNAHSNETAMEVANDTVLHAQMLHLPDVDDTISRLSEPNSVHGGTPSGLGGGQGLGEGNEDDAEYLTLLVQIEFSCVEPTTGGIWFVDGLSPSISAASKFASASSSTIAALREQRRMSPLYHYPQMYTNTMPVPCSARHNMLPVSGTARYIFPCLDKVHERCTWDLEITVPAKLFNLGFPTTHETVEQENRQTDGDDDNQNSEEGDEDEQDDDDEDVAVIASGRLIRQSQHPTDLDKRVFQYTIDVPISAPMLSIVVGTYDMHAILLDMPTVTVPVEVDLTEIRKSSAATMTASDGRDASNIGDKSWQKTNNTSQMAKVTTSVTFYPPRAVQVYYEHRHTNKIAHSCALLDQIIDYYSDVFGMYPYSDFQYHKIVFVDDLDAGMAAHGAGVTLLSAQLLCDAADVEKTYEQRKVMMQVLAVQWFGMHVLPKTWGDFWVTIGLSQFMAARFFRHHLGKNEYRFRLKKDFHRLGALDVQLPPLYYTPHPSLEFLHIKSSLVCYALDKRMVKVAASAGLTALIRRIFSVVHTATLPQHVLQARSLRDMALTPRNVGDRMLSTGAFQRWIKRFNGMDGIKAFFDQWVNFPGVPRLEFTFTCNTARGVIEFDMTQESTSVWGMEAQVPPTVFAGQVGVLIKEIDGIVYPHIFDIARATQHLETKFHSRFKYKLKQGKTKALLDDHALTIEQTDSNDISTQPSGSQNDGNTASSTGAHVVDEHEQQHHYLCETGLPEFDWAENKPLFVDLSHGLERPDLVHKYIQWVQIDPDMEWICPITLKQHDYQWGRLLKSERDVVAQFEAITHLRHYPSPKCSTALLRTLTDPNVFYRIRMDAAHALSACAVNETNWIGLEHLIGVYTLWFGSLRSEHSPLDVVPKPNNWQPFIEYYLRKSIIMSLSVIKNERGMSPRQLKLFVLNQLRCNDNRCNAYGDHEYVAHLVQCLCLVFLCVSPHHHHLFPGAEQKETLSRNITGGMMARDTQMNSSDSVPDARVIVNTLAKVEVMDLGIGFDSESDTDGEGENGVAKEVNSVVVKGVGKFGLDYGPDDDMFDEAMAEIEKLRMLELLRPAADSIVASACLVTLCRWMMAGMIPVRIDIFLEYTSYENTVKVRTTAFDCVFLLEGCFVAEIAEYLLEVVTSDPSPLIRLHVCRGFVSFARLSGAEDRGSLRERRKAVFEKLRTQFAERPWIQHKLWRMISSDDSGGGLLLDQRVRDLLLDFCDLVLGSIVMVPRFKFKNLQRTVTEPLSTELNRRPAEKNPYSLSNAGGGVGGSSGISAGAGSGTGSHKSAIKFQVPYQGYPPSKRLGPVDPTLLSRGIAVIERLKDHPCAKAFIDPVDHLQAPNYYTYITEPMDLSAAEKKLKNGHYSIIDGLIYDIRLIFKNCNKFNNENSDVWKQSKKLETFFEKDVAPNALAPPPTTPSYFSADKAALLSSSGGPVSLTSTTAGVSTGGGNTVVARTQMPIEELRRCKRMARRLREHMTSLPFQKPVTGVPGYYNVIKNPMDLSTIRRKLDTNEYERRQGFEDDVRLMLRNCFTFNPPTDPVYCAGKELESFFEREWHVYFPLPPVKLRLSQLPVNNSSTTPPYNLPATPSEASVRAISEALISPEVIDQQGITSIKHEDQIESLEGHDLQVLPKQLNNGSVTLSDKIVDTSLTVIRPLLVHVDDSPARSQSASKPTSRELKLCRRVLKRLEASPDAVAFLQPVDPIALGIPDYLKVIKCPMDLGTIKYKLKRGEYVDQSAFRNDVLLMLNNAFTFNPQESDVHQIATRLRVKFDNEWKSVIEARMNPSGSRSSMSVNSNVEMMDIDQTPSNIVITKSEHEEIPIINKVKIEPAVPPIVKQHMKALVVLKPSPPPPPRPTLSVNKKNKLRGILRMVAMQPCAAAFLHPVDPVALGIPHYRDIIKRPMDIATIRRKLETDQYSTAGEFDNDFRTMLQNCFTFNPKDDIIFANGKQLEALYLQQMQWLNPRTNTETTKILVINTTSTNGTMTPIQTNTMTSNIVKVTPQQIKPTSLISPPVVPTRAALSLSSVNEITKDTKRNLEKLVRKMKEHKLAWPFLRPVDPIRDAVPQYFDFIKTPMDFGTLDRNLYQGKYTLLAAFEADVRLVFHNCYTFNGPDNEYSKWAKQIEDLFDREWSKLAGTSSNSSSTLLPSKPKVSSPKTTNTITTTNGSNVKTSITSTPLVVNAISVPRTPTFQVAVSVGSTPVTTTITTSSSNSIASTPNRPLFGKTRTRKVLSKLQRHKSAWPFLAPVDWRKLDILTYPEVIKHPMDMGTIERKVNKREYVYMQEFVSDVKLMLGNCFLFNRPGDPVYVCGQELEVAFEAECRKMGISLEMSNPVRPMHYSDWLQRLHQSACAHSTCY